VWTPKYHYQVLFGEVKSLVDNDIRMLYDRKSVEAIELNVRIDHIHAVVSIAPKISVSTLMGTLKGKLAVKLFNSYPKLKQKPYGGITFGQEVIL
jgi:putative transposase